ncbi:hypothetical protein MPTK1_5g01940 [Marchantia polymorpha subsp. ruderalis]|uniref:Uncharacterized protein n=2 Tax=Marchantia polymorpha TaxID=3197 RepID=A0AAF6BDY6_MARPO|nr:hypothetical protein MARPO_0161s0010 [Marchantia polymorpha]BBN10220.1 hypothetical protein Mp_5g01940 [Marchantia polymorpha subsp. ruderalis]|eukprot:PTQ28507.1 hypothetical protein MARPO_0161s0010 [Marchantia polymorpha]
MEVSEANEGTHKKFRRRARVRVRKNRDRRDTSSSSGEHENVEKDDKDGILADIVTESQESSEGLNSTCHEVTVNTKKQFNAADAYEFLCQRWNESLEVAASVYGNYEDRPVIYHLLPTPKTYSEVSSSIKC